MQITPFAFESTISKYPLFVGKDELGKYVSYRQTVVRDSFKQKLERMSVFGCVTIADRQYELVVFHDRFEFRKVINSIDKFVVCSFKTFDENAIFKIEKSLAKLSGHKLDEPGSIYLVSDGEFVKIGGTSYAVTKRLNELQTGNAKLLSLLGSYNVQSKFSTEKHLHKLFECKHVRGEWFNLSEMDIYSILSKREDVINKDRFFKLSSVEVATLKTSVIGSLSCFKQEFEKLNGRFARAYTYTPIESCTASLLNKCSAKYVEFT